MHAIFDRTTDQPITGWFEDRDAAVKARAYFIINAIFTTEIREGEPEEPDLEPQPFDFERYRHLAPAMLQNLGVEQPAEV